MQAEAEPDGGIVPLPIGPLPLPEGAADAVRRSHGLAPGAPLRIAYLCGPGDVLGTYRHWEAGRNDPRVPSRAYSAMFYDLAEALDATALIVPSTPQSEPTPAQAGRHAFAPVLPRPAASRGAARASASKRLRRTEALVAEFRPHLVVAASDHPWALGTRLLAARPTYLSLHNTLWGESRLSRLKARLRLAPAARRLAGAVSTSPACARQITALAGPGLPVETEMPQAAWAVAARTRAAARRFLFLGRMEAFKGMDDLLDAFYAAAPAMPGAELTLAGDGPALAALRARAEGVPGVRLPGRLDAAGVHAALAAADVLVVPTRAAFREGLALACLEAAQHGVPSLTTRAVPAAEVLGEGAVTVPPDAPAALAAAMVRLHAAPNEVRRRSEAARRAAAPMADPSRSWAACLYRLFVQGG